MKAAINTITVKADSLLLNEMNELLSSFEKLVSSLEEKIEIQFKMNEITKKANVENYIGSDLEYSTVDTVEFPYWLYIGGSRLEVRMFYMI